MNEDEIRRIIEQQIPVDSDISQQSIEDMVDALKEAGGKEEKISPPIPENRINELKIMMEGETDWRKKAALGARIISLGLE